MQLTSRSDLFYVRLEHKSALYHFSEYVVHLEHNYKKTAYSCPFQTRLIEMEDKIKFTHVFKCTVQGLDEDLW